MCENALRAPRPDGATRSGKRLIGKVHRFEIVVQEQQEGWGINQSDVCAGSASGIGIHCDSPCKTDQVLCQQPVLHAAGTGSKYIASLMPAFVRFMKPHNYQFVIEFI